MWIGKEPKVKTLLKIFPWFGKERIRELDYICSGMWKPYLMVIVKKAEYTIHILDRFHIMVNLSKPIYKVRTQEAKELKEKDYDPVLTKSRRLPLKRPEI